MASATGVLALYTCDWVILELSHAHPQGSVELN